MEPELKRFVWRLCVLWGCIVGAWAILMSTTPMILKDIVGPSEAAEWQGIFMATTSISGMIFCTALGYYSDRLGRLEMLLPWSFAFLMAAACVTYGDIERSITLLWVSRVASLAIPSAVVFAVSSDIVTGPMVLQMHAYLGVSFGVSILVGAVTCAVIARIFSRVAALFVCCSLAAGACAVTATTSMPTKIPPKAKHESFLDAVQVVRRDPLLRNTIIAFSIVRVANVNSFAMFSLYTNYKLGWGLFDTSIVFGLTGSLGVMWQLLGVRYIVHRHQNVIPILFAILFVYPVGMVAYGCATTSVAMYTIAICSSIGGFSASIFTTKITLLAAEDGIAGMALGMVGSLQNFLEIWLGLFFGKLLSWVISTYPPTAWEAGMPYFINACIYSSAVVLLWVTHRKHGKARRAWVTSGSVDDEDTDFL